MDTANLEGIEEIAEQTSFRVNERCKHGKRGWAIPPNIERATAQREKNKAPAAPPAVAAPAPRPTAPARSASLGRLFTDYRTLIETCRARAEELALSRLELDRLAGLPAGYSSKVLGKQEHSKDPKRIWPIGLEAMLGALGLKVILIEDEAATARTLALRTPVDRANQRFGNLSRISAKLLPPPSRLTIVSPKRRGSKHG
jgi:hypothetical protein